MPQNSLHSLINIFVFTNLTARSQISNKYRNSSPEWGDGIELEDRCFHKCPIYDVHGSIVNKPSQ